MFDYIPEPLRNVDQWLVWNDKNKPRSALTNLRTGWNEDLATFDQANNYCQQKTSYQLGFAFTPDSEIIGIDLDSCRNPDTGEVEAWATEIVNQFGTYTEVSESGTGLKLIGLGTGFHHTVNMPGEKQWGIHKPHFEFFADSKYFALTGDVHESFSNVVDCQEAIQWLNGKYPEDNPEENSKSGGTKFTVPADYKQSVEDYNRRTPIITLLTGHGYQLDSQGRPVRPGKDPGAGHSATIDDSGDCERVTFWSSHCEPFEQSVAGQQAHTYDAWSVNVLLNFGGDFSAAKAAEFENGSITISGPTPDPEEQTIEPDSVLPYRPFPTESLPKCAKEFVRDVAKTIDCNEASVALPLLSGMSAAIGNVARLFINYSYIIPSVIWTCVVAKSGSGKTPPWKQVRNLFSPYDEQWHHEYEKAKKQFAIDESTYKKTFAKWKVGDPMPVAPERPPDKRILVSDVTIEKLAQLHGDNPKGLFVCVDELAGLLAGFDRYSSGSGELNQWIKLYGGLELVQDRKVAESAYVPKTSISIAGTIQPERLFSTIGTEGFAAGLAGRFAIACPPNRIRRFNLTEQPQQSFTIESVIHKLLFKPLQFNENDVVQPAMVKMSQAGREVYKAFFDEKQELIFEHDGPITAALSKLVEMALLFSPSFHLFKNPSGRDEAVPLATVIESIEVAEFFIHEAKRLYLSPDAGISQLCRVVLEVLTARRGQKLSVRDLTQQRRPLRHAGPDLVLQACHQLVRLGHIQTEVEGTRKPKIVFFVPVMEASTVRF